MSRLSKWLVVLAVAVAGTADAQQKITIRQKLSPLTLGLAGYGGAEGARSDSEQLQKTLSQKLGRDVTTRIYGDNDSLAAALASGQVDLAWMQPFAVVGALKKGAIKPLVKAVRHGLPFYRGVLFTKADRKVEGGLKGLGGTSVAWASRSSAAGYLFPRAAVVQAGLKPGAHFKKEDFLGDHAAVCQAVLEGKADVGATFADDRPAGEAMKVDGCVQFVGEEAAAGLKIVATSAPIPNDAIAARPDFSADDAARVRQALLGLTSDVDGKVLLAAVFKAEGFDEVGADDFEPVKFAAEAASK